MQSPPRVLWVLTAAVVAACSESSSVQLTSIARLSGPTMGVQWSVKVAQTPRGHSFASASAELQRELDAVNQAMSTYIADSEICRFNRAASNEWFEVSSPTAVVIDAGLGWTNETDGAFDMTVGPLVDLWSFGPTPAAPQRPDDDALAAARARLGSAELEVQHASPALRKGRSDIAVDLSAIAKGYAVDVLAEWLLDHDVTGFLVEIGGEVRTHGVRPDGAGWRVGIERPVEDLTRREVYRALELGDRALATSGDYRNYFEADGRRYSHTIDPRTGEPVTHALASVSVVHDRCRDADALATAFMVLGPRRGYDKAVELGLAASFLIRDGDRFEARDTPLFVEWFGATPSDPPATNPQR